MEFITSVLTDFLLAIAAVFLIAVTAKLVFDAYFDARIRYLKKAAEHFRTPNTQKGN